MLPFEVINKNTYKDGCFLLKPKVHGKIADDNQEISDPKHFPSIHVLAITKVQVLEISLKFVGCHRR